TPNKIVSLTDNSGRLGTIAGTFTTVATSGTNKFFRGLAFTPETTDGTSNVDLSVGGTTNSNSLTTLNATSNLKIGSSSTLRVNANTSVYNLTLEAGSRLNFNASEILTVNSDLLLKAGLSNSFSTYIGNGTLAVGGDIKYLKTIDGSKWYFISFPTDVSISSIKKSDGSTLGVLGTNWSLKYYDGALRAVNGGTVSNWKAITNADLLTTPTLKLNKYQGYIIALTAGAAATEISFTLNKAEISSEATARNVPIAENKGAAATTNHGWNLIGQPYLSKFTANNATGGDSYYIYVSDGVSTYTAYTQALAPELNPMSAYFIQASSLLAESDITFALTGRRQSIPASVQNNLTDNVQINFSTNTGTDNTNLIVDNNRTTGYEIGKDLEKWIGTGTDKPQVYTQLDGISYAFNALPLANLSNLSLGYYSKTASRTTISATVPQTTSLSSLFLNDSHTGDVTNLLTNSYSFDTDAGTDNNRFTLSAQRVPTKLVVGSETNAPIISTLDGQLSIVNLQLLAKVKVYDAVGRIIYSNKAKASSLQVELPSAGIYIVQITVGAQSWKRKIVLN
ncbi:MAG: T9SS type A sorting domain-containing protein, partial [Paludibacter sp.]